MGLVTGIASKSGVYNTDPLKKFLKKFFDEYGGVFKRRVGMSSVDVNSGTYMIFNETVSDPIKAIVSSASIPFVFPNQAWPNLG